ncbi:UdgX family uracil-DNA binding protein [Rubripirellula reticaptiva]|uniref:Type-4 uracil-DNA glycosylase n=1 Tax=Rubripirellula reticaptiva TaxID=2528013 RepID=A0A5C6EHX4_9BACT|nr:UdgX family uracil-DNA binding protein [Rubripirellula reticaptiva]TWU46829.1 Uracil DNA glycosylase superfamily protein [Rubripirellula reticaptiva]
MTHFLNIETFDQWRTEARLLLAQEVEPFDINFLSSRDQPLLFADDRQEASPANTTHNVPKLFLDLARNVACHRKANRWELLYRTLWRLTHGERSLLQITTDDDIHELLQMQKAVKRDVHKMKAFVRFRKVESVDESENYIAWHRPDHHIVRLAAPFFARRFNGMNWTILTPDESVAWDQHELQYGAGVPASEAPDGDVLEELWKTYYASIFNPARVKVAMMKREMPVRHWPTLPEAELIEGLLQQAPKRVNEMIEQNEGFDRTATHYMPQQSDLDSLREAAKCCHACDLHQFATQMVFGEGAKDARIVLVGEQPGDREDIEGRPFVGPAGKLLDNALARAGVNRNEVYITNVVKHFKFTERGKRRLHKKPNSREIFACRPWLEAELAAIQPEAIICLGATPAQALLGRDFRISKSRGQVLATDWCKRTVATWHPAAILRMPDVSRREQMEQQLVGDLRLSVA